MNDVKKLCQSLLDNGATKAYFVGGSVIDLIDGRKPKDIDIEVFGITYDEIVSTLQNLGYKCSFEGKQFGAVIVYLDNYNVDITIPRVERSTGLGYTDFVVDLIPDLSLVDAMNRRDLTINAIYKDVISGEIVDLVGGLDDLKTGTLREVNKHTFSEDALRPLRVMQLLPRKGKSVAKSLIRLCSSMIDTFHSLPKDRVLEEFKKLLLKSKKPSMGLQFLVDSCYIKLFPELDKLIGCPQNPIHHPEGDVWTHTKLVLDNGAKLKFFLNDSDQLAYMFGLLLHDVGKPNTTTEDLKSIGHEVVGSEIATTFMNRISDSPKLIRKVKSIVSNHMRPYHLVDGKARKGKWKKLSDNIDLTLLAYVVYADSCGKGNGLNLDNVYANHCLVNSVVSETINKLINGKFLISKGHAPSVKFGKAISVAYELQLSGEENIDQLYKSVKNLL